MISTYITGRNVYGSTETTCLKLRYCGGCVTGGYNTEGAGGINCEGKLTLKGGSKNADLQNICRALFKYWQEAVKFSGQNEE